MQPAGRTTNDPPASLFTPITGSGIQPAAQRLHLMSRSGVDDLKADKIGDVTTTGDVAGNDQS